MGSHFRPQNMNQRDMFWSLNYSPHAAISFCRREKTPPLLWLTNQIEVKNIVIVIIIIIIVIFSNVIIVIIVVGIVIVILCCCYC